MNQIKQATDRAVDALRISMDSKATIKIGPFSRGGKNRVRVCAADHDFQPEALLTPFGIFLPKYDDVFLYFTQSKVTSDFIVDRLDEWWRAVRKRFPRVKTLVIQQDNGPENNSRRTQFIHRIVGFARGYQLTVRLAYYPPYHSKYNPIERCWGVLENHWNGDLLDEVETVLKFAQTMTWSGRHPAVNLITQTYPTGIKLNKPAMQALEGQIRRMPNLEKWFVDIPFA